MNPRRSPYSVVTSLALFAAALFLFMPTSGAAQQEGPGWKVRSPFRPLDLATPNTIRTGAGLPGPDYWQQQVDYRIEAALDPADHTLTGSQTIRYHNNSPHALSVLWLKLDTNLCHPESKSQVLAVPPLLPWWQTVLGSAFAIIVAKQLFGGIGFNPFNPAMAGYVLLLISFPVTMTRWLPPDIVSGTGLTLVDSLHIAFAGFREDIVATHVNGGFRYVVEIFKR